MVAFKSILTVRWTILMFLVSKVDCKFEFKNIECTVLDKDFMDIDECFLKSFNRTFKYMSLKTKIHQLPVNDLTVKVEVLQRLNGYKPFLYNFTVDACKFLKGEKKTRVIQFFYDLFASYSNLIHKCPYNHDIFVNKLPISYLDHMLSNVLPVPEGVYCLHSIYIGNGIPVMDLKVYVQIY